MRAQRVNGRRALAKMERRACGSYIALLLAYARPPDERRRRGARSNASSTSLAIGAALLSVTARVGPVPLVAHHHTQLSRASNELSAPGERSRTESRLRARTNSPRQALAGLPFCDGRRASVVLSESGGARRLGHDGGFPAARAVVGTSAFGIGNGGGRFDQMIARRCPVLVTAQSPRVVYRGHAARDDGQTVGSRATAQFISSPGGLRGRSCEAPGPNRACICVVTPRRDAGSLRLDRRAADDAGPTAWTKTWRRKRPSSSRICTGGRHPGGHRLRVVYGPNTTTPRLADGREMAILEAVPGSRLSC